MICGCFFGVAYSSREWSELGSRDMDGKPKGRASGNEQVNRTSPELRPRFGKTRAGVLLGDVLGMDPALRLDFAVEFGTTAQWPIK